MNDALLFTKSFKSYAAEADGIISWFDLTLPFFSFLTEVEFDCERYDRAGHLSDGGWDVCLDGVYKPRSPCLVYSFGWVSVTDPHIYVLENKTNRNLDENTNSRTFFAIDAPGAKNNSKCSQSVWNITIDKNNRTVILQKPL